MNKLIKKGIVIFSTLIVITQVTKVGITSLLHIPYFSYDESNTLRIASQTPKNIIQILSHEQNFPAYYLFIQKLSEFGRGTQTVVFFQFCLWILSIYLFWRISNKLFKSEQQIYLSRVLYSLCSLIYKYAFYIRMYMLILVLSEVVFLQLIELRNKNHFSKFLILVSASIITLLHPGSILFVAILFATLFRFSDFRKFSFILLICCSTLFCINISLKTDVFVIFSSGVEYLKGSTQNPFMYANSIFSEYPTALHWIFVIIAALSITQLKKVLQLKQTPPQLFILLSTICVLAIGISSELSLIQVPGRHFIFLAVPLLLFILQFIFKQGTYSRIVLTLSIFVLLFIQSEYFIAFNGQQENKYKTLCETFQPIAQMPIITEFHTLNALMHCFEGRQDNIYLINKANILDISRMSLEEVLQVQSIQGGKLSPAQRGSYIQYLEQNPDVFSHIQTNISHVLQNKEQFAYVITNRDYSDIWLSNIELQLLNGYHFQAFKSPAVYIFEK